MIKCTKCEQDKPESEFRKNSRRVTGHESRCKACLKVGMLKACERYYKKHKKECLERSKKWGETNKDKASEIDKRYYKSHKQKRFETNKKWLKETIQNDPSHRIVLRLRSRIGYALRKKTGKIKKADHTLELLGCTVEELKLYLEKRFVDGMSWDNYGKWHVDHIRPCASFDLRDEEEQKKCFHYSNLQPLWAEDNLRKSKQILKLE